MSTSGSMMVALRWFLMEPGRFEVVEWLTDDPYPRALVRELEIEPEGRNDHDLLRTARGRFDALIELGQTFAAGSNRVTTSRGSLISTMRRGKLAGQSPCSAS